MLAIYLALTPIVKFFIVSLCICTEPRYVRMFVIVWMCLFITFNHCPIKMPLKIKVNCLKDASASHLKKKVTTELMLLNGSSLLDVH